MEFVRKTSPDELVIITNRLRTNFHLVFYKNTDPFVAESFKIPIQSGKIKVTMLKNGTLIIRGDSETPEYTAVLETVTDVLEGR